MYHPCTRTAFVYNDSTLFHFMKLSSKLFTRLLLSLTCLVSCLQFGCQSDSQATRAQMAQKQTTPMNSVEYNQGPLFYIRKQFVSGSLVGSEYNYRLEVTAREDVANVLIEERIPEEVTFEKSNPVARSENGKIFWTFPIMNKGETKIFDIYYVPQTDGEYRVCSVVSGDPRICVPLIAGFPKLHLTKSGPSNLEVNDTAAWTLSVTNAGSAVASNVMLKDWLPEGFEATSATEYNLGDLVPGQTKEIKVIAKAIQEGAYTNIATATFQNSKLEVKSSLPVEVIQSHIEITKEGPATAHVFSPASYAITVTNAGKNVLEGLTVVDTLPDFVNIVESGGGAVKDHEITWMIDQLGVGQSQSYNVRFSANNPGETVNRVAVSTAKGVHASAEARTVWQAAPGLHIAISDSKDPIQVGETIVYTADIINQGNFDPVQAQVRLVFTEELKPTQIMDGNMQGTIDGLEVIYPDVTIQAGQDLQTKIYVQGVKPGTGKGSLQVKADFLPRVIVSEESTTVY